MPAVRPELVEGRPVSSGQACRKALEGMWFDKLTTIGLSGLFVVIILFTRHGRLLLHCIMQQGADEH